MSKKGVGVGVAVASGKGWGKGEAKERLTCTEEEKQSKDFSLCINHCSNEKGNGKPRSRERRAQSRGGIRVVGGEGGGGSSQCPAQDLVVKPTWVTLFIVSGWSR